MELHKKLSNDYLVYEHKELGLLVAIEKADQIMIKKFWKKNKGKSILEKDVIKGYPFVYDEEQDSLKIDFSEQKEYAIRSLVKFDA